MDMDNTLSAHSDGGNSSSEVRKLGVVQGDPDG
jgi:hypothetical protein